MPFTHVVTFKWGDDDVDPAGIAAALGGLANRLPGVLRYHCGADAGFSPGAYDFAVVGTFEDRDAFVGYRDHPDHQRILAELIVPHLESRTVVQLED